MSRDARNQSTGPRTRPDSDERSEPPISVMWDRGIHRHDRTRVGRSSRLTTHRSVRANWLGDLELVVNWNRIVNPLLCSHSLSERAKRYNHCRAVIWEYKDQQKTIGSRGYLGETQHVRIYHTGETRISRQPTIDIYGHEALTRVKLLLVRVIQNCLGRAELTDIIEPMRTSQKLCRLGCSYMGYIYRW